MKSIDLKKAPKLFCENIRIGHSPEYFVVAFNSGDQAQLFSLTPAHAKRFLQYLEFEISEYETKNGVITASWDPSVISPVQRANPPLDKS